MMMKKKTENKRVQKKIKQKKAEQRGKRRIEGKEKKWTKSLEIFRKQIKATKEGKKQSWKRNT